MYRNIIFYNGLGVRSELNVEVNSITVYILLLLQCHVPYDTNCNSLTITTLGFAKSYMCTWMYFIHCTHSNINNVSSDCTCIFMQKF